MPMIVINRPTCTTDSHAVLRSNREVFVKGTVFAGWQPDADGGCFELRRCKGCGSTLSDGTGKPVGEVAHVA